MTSGFLGRIVGLGLSLTFLAVTASAQFDNSGDQNISGDYFVREVLLTSFNTSTGTVGRGISLTGIMTFDGAGDYSFSGQRMDSQNGATTITNQAGSYALAGNGLIALTDVIDTSQFVFGSTGVPGNTGTPFAIVGSTTESPHRNIFIAVPAAGPNFAVDNTSLQGKYRVGFIDFLQGNASLVRDGYFTLSTSGDGNWAGLTVAGAMANLGSKSTTQNISGATYNITDSEGIGTLDFPPVPSESTLVAGEKALFFSADGILLAGDLNGYDIMVGIPAPTDVVDDSAYQGTYFTAALENDASQVSKGLNNVDAYYGSTFAFGDGTSIAHLRLAQFNGTAFDDTYAPSTYNIATNGIFKDGNLVGLLGDQGFAYLKVGTGSFYTLTLGVYAGEYSGGAPLLDPLKVWNAASFAPITNAVAPGGFVSLFGTGLAAGSVSAQTLPLPTTLGNVQVSINNVLAPVSYVSQNQINVLVPYGTTGGFATFVVNNGGTVSNEVTVYLADTAPGVYTVTQGGFTPGIGPAAALHANYSLVTESNPAKVGETLQLYVNGLGAVSPAVADGAAAPGGSGLSKVVSDVGIFVDGQPAGVTFKGLAPGFAGLYQVNFVVPPGVSSGLVTLAVSTPEAFASEALLYLQ